MEDLPANESRRPSVESYGRSRRSQDVTARLLKAAVEVFGEYGYEAARVYEIARRCGLSTGAVYARWPTKPDLFVDVVKHVTSQRSGMLVDNVELSTAERFALLDRSLLSLDGDSLRDLMLEASVVVRRDRDLQMRVSASLADEAGALSAMVAEGKSSGVIDASLSTDAVVLLYQSLGLGTRIAQSTGSTEQSKPTAEQWDSLMERIIEAVGPSRNGE